MSISLKSSCRPAGVEAEGGYEVLDRKGFGPQFHLVHPRRQHLHPQQRDLPRTMHPLASLSTCRKPGNHTTCPLLSRGCAAPRPLRTSHGAM